MDLHQESHEKSKSSWAWQSAKGKGNTDETLIQTQMQAQGEMVIRAVEGLQIDIREINQHSISQTIDAMVAAQPDLMWMKELEQRGDVDWRLVKEIHDSFSYSHSGLSGPAAMVVAIVVAYFTAGAASGMVAGMAGGAGATATAGTAWATATATTAAGWANVAATAAITSAASGAAISTINNRGDIGAVLKDITSSDALKGYVVSGVTAGFTTGVLDQAFGVTGDNINHVTKGFDLSKPAELMQFGAYLGAQGGAQAMAQTALLGGSLEENLQASLTSQLQHLLQASVFNAVGDYAQATNLEDGSAGKIALHALVGGMLSEATGGDFTTGALAAGANEALIEQLSGVIKGDKSLELAVSQLIGIAAATVTGGDYAKAAELAKNATAYNRQLHIDEIRYASDEERVQRYAEQQGVSTDQARQELLRAAAAMVDHGWTVSLDEAGALSADALYFLQAELLVSRNDLFQVTEQEYYNERLGLKEMLHSREAVEALVRDIALVDPLAYRTNPEYFHEVMNAKGEGSQEGFGNVVGAPVDAVVWAAGAVMCPSCAMDDLLAAWDAVKNLPEDLSYKGYLDTLHIMQGGGEEVIRRNAVSSTELGIGLGLGASPAGALSARALILERIERGGSFVELYGPMNKGPLSDDIAKTFRGGSYREIITTEPVILYRVISDDGNPEGGYWTRTQPAGPVQSIIDSALDPVWGNTATRVIEMEVPSGTRLFEGAAAPQRGLVGGGNQLYFDKEINPLDPNWIKK
ncbi:DUF637 domain-containing protein [Halopseudomonas yangmingensis]|nr:DUF637 domain-containing protein [Halopseudomonas yangmingensis]